MKNIPLKVLLSSFLLLLFNSSSAQSMKELIRERLTDDIFHRITYLTHEYMDNYVQLQTEDHIASRNTLTYFTHPASETFTDSVSLKYDGNGNLTYRETLIYRNGAWKPLVRTTFTYHSDSKVMKWESESFDNGLWGYSSRRLNEYDSQGNLISEKLNSYNVETNEWDPRYIYSYEYDTDGNQVRNLRQLWYADAFIDDKEMISSYDDRNNLIELNTVERRIGERRYLFEYDDNDNLIKSTIERYENEAWNPISLIIVQYDNQWNETSEVLYQIKDDSSEWVPERKYKMEYDSKGRLINTILSHWKSDIGDIRLSKKFSNFFEEENEKLTHIEYHYYPQNNEYIEGNIFNYEFSDDGNLEYYFAERRHHSSINQREFFYDSEENPTNINDFESLSLSIFPNPTRDYLIIEWDLPEMHELEFYDSKGTKLMKEKLAPGSKEYYLELDEYNPGMYMVLIRDRQGAVATEKVLIK